MPQIVVFDANALLMPFQFGINIDMDIERLVGEFHGVVPSPILGEIRKCGGRWAKVALSLAKKYEITRTENTGDKAVIEIAEKLNGIVVTNDEELQRKLRLNGIPYIYLRSRHRLEMWNREEIGYIRP